MSDSCRESCCCIKKAAGVSDCKYNNESVSCNTVTNEIAGLLNYNKSRNGGHFKLFETKLIIHIILNFK